MAEQFWAQGANNRMGQQEAQFKSQWQQTGNPCHGVKNIQSDTSSEFGPADPKILISASFENEL